MRVGDVVYYKAGYNLVAREVIIRVSARMAYSARSAFTKNGQVVGTDEWIDNTLKESYERQEAISCITRYVNNCSTEKLNRINQWLKKQT